MTEIFYFLKSGGCVYHQHCRHLFALFFHSARSAPWTEPRASRNARELEACKVRLATASRRIAEEDGVLSRVRETYHATILAIPQVRKAHRILHRHNIASGSGSGSAAGPGPGPGTGPGTGRGVEFDVIFMFGPFS